MLNKIYIAFFIIISPIMSKGQIAGLTGLVKKVDPSIIKIYTINSAGEYERQGSAVLISTTGIGITNYHVLAGAKKAIAINNTGIKYQINTILDYSVSNDLIKFQLTTAGKTTASAMLSSVKLDKGMDVFSLGFPNGFEIDGGSTVSTGIISGFRNIDNHELIQTTAPITHGSSGGGLFDSAGKLCGITTGTFASDIKDRHANLNKAVPVSGIKILERNLNLSLSDFYTQISRDNIFISAMEAYEAADYDNAIIAFNEHLKMFPDDAVAWFRMGNSYNQIGRKKLSKYLLERAMFCLNNAIDLDTNYYSALGQGSMVSMLLGDKLMAFEYAKKAYDIAPTVSFTNYVLGWLNNYIRDYKQAIAYFDVAIQLASEKQHLHQWHLERAIAHDWIKQDLLAEIDFKKSIELNSRNEDAIFYYANFFLTRERNLEACVQLRNLYKINSQFSMEGQSVVDYIQQLCE